jgi:ribonucleotide reductase beta subunit family protein with ferritin-like domain
MKTLSKTQAMNAADDLLDSIIESREALFCWRPSDIEGDVSAFEELTDAERKCFEQTMKMLEVLEPEVPFNDRTRH